MEAQFTPQSARLLKALILSGKKPDGLLFGHRQGDAFIITDILPTGGGFFNTLENLWAIDNLYEGRFLGFFTFSAGEEKVKRIMAPWAFGKILLRIGRQGDGAAGLTAAKVEFEDIFFLREIKIHSPN
jgi:hypothetical protein